MQALQTKLETLTNQNSDSKQHIDVLKESLNAKEQRANTLQTEVSPNTHARSQKRHLQTHSQPYDSIVGDDNRLVENVCVAWAGAGGGVWGVEVNSAFPTILYT